MDNRCEKALASMDPDLASSVARSDAGVALSLPAARLLAILWYLLDSQIWGVLPSGGLAMRCFEAVRVSRGIVWVAD